jgi:aminopeptidase N
MLHDYIGDDAFRKGLHNYLTEYSYKNTVTENLWSHLAKASNKPINEVMSSWTLQMVC